MIIPIRILHIIKRSNILLNYIEGGANMPRSYKTSEEKYAIITEPFQNPDITVAEI
jgi:hypothetical protein